MDILHLLWFFPWRFKNLLKIIPNELYLIFVSLEEKREENLNQIQENKIRSTRKFFFKRLKDSNFLDAWKLIQAR